MTRHDSNPTTTTNRPTLATVCGHCGVEERKLLHNIRLRGNFRRLCTTCVLRLHPQCFCPYCLGVFDCAPPDDAVVCYKCYSSSHPTCVTTPLAGSVASSRGPSPCSSCLNPNALVLNIKRVENGSGSGGRAINNIAARLLLAAGKIASMSINKAEVAAAMEAERRSKEAAFTKKRAREALAHVVYLMGREKRMAVDGNKKVVNANNSVVVAPVEVNNKVDASTEVMEALNAVVLKEGGRQLHGFSVGNGVSEAQGKRVATMAVDVINGKDSGLNSVAQNGSVKIDHSLRTAQGETIRSVKEQIHHVEKNSVSTQQP